MVTLKNSEYQLAYCLLKSLYPEEWVFYQMVDLWRTKIIVPHFLRKGYEILDIYDSFSYFYKLIRGEEELNADLAYKVCGDMKNKEYDNYTNELVNPRLFMSLMVLLPALKTKVDEDKYFTKMREVYLKWGC